MVGKKAVHFGGGNIGRGFVAEKLSLSGYEVVFIDVVDNLIKQLQETKSYKVKEIGDGGSEKVNTITNYRAINSKTHEQDVIDEISTADVVTCAVGPNVMRFIAPVIAKAIAKRQTGGTPLAVIACENMVYATSNLEKMIKDPKNTDPSQVESMHKKARFANSAIDRIVPGQPPNAGLDVTIESFFEWCVEETPFEPDFKHPEIQAVHWVRNLEPYIERKLYTVNTSHAAAAYYGHNAGIPYIHSVMENEELKQKVRACVEETSALIVDKHGISEKEQADYREKILTRISNPLLQDIVERVGRAPLRKLGLKERFIGPAAPLAAKGMKHTALLGAIEQAFRFQNVEGDEESAELAKIMRDHKASEVVEKVTELKSSDKLFNDIVKIVEKVQQSTPVRAKL